MNNKSENLLGGDNQQATRFKIIYNTIFNHKLLGASTTKRGKSFGIVI